MYFSGVSNKEEDGWIYGDYISKGFYLEKVLISTVVFHCVLDIGEYSLICKNSLVFSHAQGIEYFKWMPRQSKVLSCQKWKEGKEESSKVCYGGIYFFCFFLSINQVFLQL